MVDEYGPALLVDVIVVVACVTLLARFGDLRFSHPATPYIVFHLHTVTARLAGLLNGAPNLYSKNLMYFEAVMPFEIVRAAQYCDLAFCAVTVVWIAFALRVRSAPPPPPRQRLMLDPRLLRPILLLAFIGGIVGLRVAATVPGMGQFEGFNPESAWSQSSYLAILPSWFGLAVLGHAYYYGFNKISGLLVAGYLGMMAVQGGARFRVIIGLLLAIQIALERANRRWPSRIMVLWLGIAAVLFFPMKQIGVQFQRGDDLSQIATAVTDSATNMSEGTAGDQMFLDQFASALTLIDLRGEKYLGSIYIPLLTLPIPRALWPDKPVLAAFLTDISTRARPMATSGMITTYLGESYANFGIFGIFLVPPLVAIALATFQRRAASAPYHSVLRFAYVLLSVNLLQVYRDGLQSVVLFMFVHMMPLMAIVLAHVLRSFIQRTGNLHAPAEVALASLEPDATEERPAGAPS
jgi:hypothetical protein